MAAPGFMPVPVDPRFAEDLPAPAAHPGLAEGPREPRRARVIGAPVGGDCGEGEDRLIRRDYRVPGAGVPCPELSRRAERRCWVALAGMSVVVGYSFGRRVLGTRGAAPARSSRSPAAGSQRPSAARPSAASDRGLRLVMVSVTSEKNLLAKALRAERLIMKHAGPRDRMSYVCRRRCAEIGRQMSRNMIEMPDVLPMSSSANGSYVIDRCQRIPKKRLCNAYEQASFKYVFGFVHEVKRFLNSVAGEMPEYWMIRDDDTYVHIPNMMGAIERHGGAKPFNPYVERVAWVSSGPCFICGGAGMVLTGALAVELATAHGDRWMEEQREGIENRSFYWDTHMPKVISWIKGAKLIRIPEMSPFSVADTKICRRRKGCIRTPECDCAPTAQPATWHMSVSFNRSLEILSRIP